MQRSETITALATALAAAQGAMEGAAKASKNPHFKNDYADLASVWQAVRKPLADNGLSIAQFPSGEGGAVSVETVLMHKSGEWIADRLTLPVSKQDAQGYGSAITYARRYSLMSVCGIAPVDDDGNGAAGVGGSTSPAKIGAAQAKEIAEMIRAVEADAAAFLGYLGVDRLEDLPAAQFDRAIAALRAKAKKRADARKAEQADADQAEQEAHTNAD